MRVIEVGVKVHRWFMLFGLILYATDIKYCKCSDYASVFFFLSQSIGQAYEDMQTQNQHLLQQITERDDYNIKVLFLWMFRVCYVFCQVVHCTSMCCHAIIVIIVLTVEWLKEILVSELEWLKDSHMLKQL